MAHKNPNKLHRGQVAVCVISVEKANTWMSHEVSKWLVSGYNPSINRVYWGLQPTYQPFTNFRGHPNLLRFYQVGGSSTRQWYK